MNLIEKEQDFDKTISKFIDSDNEILKKKGIKLKEIQDAKLKGWKGISVDELDYDIEDLYIRLIDSLKGIKEFTKDELVIISLINSIKKDKIDLIKFIKTHELKLKEIEYKYEPVNENTKKEIEL